MEIANEVPAKKTKRLTSVVWNHFERVKKADSQYAICHHCKKKLSGSSNSGTTHLRNHLVRCLKRSNYDVSQILSAKRKRKEGIVGQSSLGLATVTYEEGKIKDEILSPIPLKYEQEQLKDEISQTLCLGNVKFDQERSWMDLARMIMMHGYSPAMIDHIGFKIFIKNLQPMFEFNNRTIEHNFITIYGKEKQKVFESINLIQGRINLAVYMWGSFGSSEYMSLTANYIDEDWRLQKRMLNFITLDPSHSDDMLSEVVVKCLTDWAIDRKLFSMTFDECSAYEVTVCQIKDRLSQIRPLLKNGELFDVCCFVHLLKSVVQEVLEACSEVTNKIRETVRHIKSEQAILGKFNEIALQVGINSHKRLVLDCPMQWNTTFMMLKAAIEYKSALCLMQEHDPAFSMTLSEIEWNWTNSVASFMKLILEFINIFVGNKYPTANVFFPEICDMHIQLVEWCRNPDDFLSSVALKMKNKFDGYWKKCNLALAIAAVLDPRFKMKLVEYYYRQIYGNDAPDRIKEVLEGLRELFEEYYTMGMNSVDQEPTLPGSNLSNASSSTRDKLKGFDKFLHETSQIQSMASDLDKYLEEPIFPRNHDFSILNWWKVHTPRYPILSIIARDVLAIPVSTLGPDVAFSNRGRMLDHFHSALTPDIREALVCGQDWLKTEPEASSASLGSSPLPLLVESGN